MDLSIDPEQFSMRGVVDKMNKAMARSGATVQLKKKTASGLYVNA